MTYALTVKRCITTVWRMVINIFVNEGSGSPRKKKGQFAFTVGLVESKPKRTMLQVKLTNEQQVTVSLKPVTASGKVAQLDGVPTWEVISGNSTVTPAADGRSAVVRSSDDPGDTQILVKADADLGEGVEEISDTITVTVEGARAANLGLEVGTPEVKT